MKKISLMAILVGAFVLCHLPSLAQAANFSVDGRPTMPCTTRTGQAMSMEVVELSGAAVFNFRITSNIGAKILVTTEGELQTYNEENFVVKFPVIRGMVREYAVNCSDNMGNVEGCIIVIDPANYEDNL